MRRINLFPAENNHRSWPLRRNPSLEWHVLSKTTWSGRSRVTFSRKLRNIIHHASFTRRAGWLSCLLISLVALAAPHARGESLNWEGQTGAFATPFAYTSPSPKGWFGLPAVSFSLPQWGRSTGRLLRGLGYCGFPEKILSRVNARVELG